MSRKAFRLIGCMLLVLAVTAGTVHAADEDTAASAYLVFDPETGEFQTTQDIKRNSMHQAQQEAIDSIAPVEGVSPPAVTATPGRSTQMAGWIIVGVLVLVAAGYIRKRQRARAR